MTSPKTWTGTRYKILGIPLEKSAESAEDGALFVRGKFTSDRPDEYGDIITRGATERAIPKYKQWGNIRRMHLPEPVAKVVRIGEPDGLEWNEVEIKVIDPRAKFEVENGLLAALSVGILIDFEDIEFNEETGGLTINDYLLAEISLVDHPANYDAVLERVKGVLGTIASQGGQAAALKSLDEIRAELSAAAETEKAMHEEKDAVETQPIDAMEEAPMVEMDKSAPCREDDESVEDCVDRKVPEIMEENPDMDNDQAVAIAQDMCEDGCDEDASAEDGIHADAEPAAEVDAERAIEAEHPPTVFSDPILKALNDLANEFRASLATTLAEVQRTVKALAEAQAAQGAAVEPEAVPEPKPVDEEEEALVPAERKGAVAETELPGETAEQPVQREIRPVLRSALDSYFKAKTSH